MSLELSTSKIIVYSLAIAFVYAKLFMPELRGWYIKRIHDKRVADWKSGKREDLGNINELIASLRKPIKPFDCIKCLSFWFSIPLSLLSQHTNEVGLIAIVSLACGMLLEGILMRYF